MEFLIIIMGTLLTVGAVLGVYYLVLDKKNAKGFMAVLQKVFLFIHNTMKKMPGGGKK